MKRVYKQGLDNILSNPDRYFQKSRKFKKYLVLRQTKKRREHLPLHKKDLPEPRRSRDTEMQFRLSASIIAVLAIADPELIP